MDSKNKKPREYPEIYEKTLPMIFALILGGILVMFIVIFGVLLGFFPF